MLRALQEALEFALSVQPDLLDPAEMKKRFPRLVCDCLLAADQVRRGKKSESEFPALLYGTEDVPRAKIQRIITRTQRELEKVAIEAPPSDAEGISQLPWMSVLHLYGAGITAYIGSSDYRARERLASVISAARDPYMLPMAISSGVLLTLHLAQYDKPSRMLRTRDATRKAIDEFLDCWEWISIYAELLSIVRRRYGLTKRRPRIMEINRALDGLLDDGLKGMAPQAQMIAALCAYMVGQFEDKASTIVQWADVYRRSSMAVDRTSKLYQRTCRRMYVRAYMVAKDYASTVPLIEQILDDEFATPRAKSSAEYATYIAWLTRGLLSQSRYREALTYLRRVDSALMKNAPENVRRILILYTSVATSLSGNGPGAFDRRLLRIAIFRNESSSRRASQHSLRLGALIALLIHIGNNTAPSSVTSKDVAEKLLVMVNLHAQIRTCPRTTAFVRIIAVLEQVDHVSVAQVHRAAAVDRQMAILNATTPDFVLEVAPYEEILEHVYGSRLRELYEQRTAKQALKKSQK
ncbi:MAG: hypothetical protein FGM32_02175 [Candidatus Kapabacteria bacterium]|nr:hypothetical protein [Candidatus Kapabacteria bacterium]